MSDDVTFKCTHCGHCYFINCLKSVVECGPASIWESKPGCIGRIPAVGEFFRCKRCEEFLLISAVCPVRLEKLTPEQAKNLAQDMADSLPPGEFPADLKLCCPHCQETYHLLGLKPRTEKCSTDGPKEGDTFKCHLCQRAAILSVNPLRVRLPISEDEYRACAAIDHGPIPPLSEAYKARHGIVEVGVTRAEFDKLSNDDNSFPHPSQTAAEHWREGDEKRTFGKVEDHKPENGDPYLECPYCDDVVESFALLGEPIDICSRPATGDGYHCPVCGKMGIITRNPYSIRKPESPIDQKWCDDNERPSSLN